MNIETKFDLGDRVWQTWNGSESYWEPCAFCNATGRISSADGSLTSACPTCYGRKGDTEWRPKAWLVNGPFTVGQVRVQITDSPGLDQSDEPIEWDNYKARTDSEEKYMLVETGIGSGTLHDADNLHATEEEAQAACEQRNALAEVAA